MGVVGAFCELAGFLLGLLAKLGQASRLAQPGPAAPNARQLDANPNTSGSRVNGVQLCEVALAGKVELAGQPVGAVHGARKMSMVNLQRVRLTDRQKSRACMRVMPVERIRFRTL